MRTSLLRSSLLASLATTGLLAACGYTPLYAPGAGAADAASHVQVGEINTENMARNVGERRPAQTIEKQLKLSFPNTGAEMDTVTVSIREDTDTLAVQRTAAVQRAQINLSGRITLMDPNGHNLLLTSVATTVPYNVEDTPYSTESGKTFARLTAARNLADEVARRLYLFYSTHKNTGHTVPSVPPSVTPAVIPVPNPFVQ